MGKQRKQVVAGASLDLRLSLSDGRSCFLGFRARLDVMPSLPVGTGLDPLGLHCPVTTQHGLLSVQQILSQG